MPRFAKVLVGLAVLACAAVAPASAMALPGANVSSTKLVQHVDYPETQHLHFEYGPIEIPRARTTSRRTSTGTSPRCPGYITRFKPNLVYSGGRKVPRVDVIHLHHGVWLNNGYPTFAAGEEKTVHAAPARLRLPLPARATAGS